MNPHRTRDSILGVIGFAALVIYILACASFSPDDSKVLFPTFDAKTGGVAVAVYDRQAGSTAQLLTLQSGDAVWMRPAWMPDGRRALAIWAVNRGSGFSSSTGDRVNIAVLPIRLNEPPRIMTVALPENDMNSYLLLPPPFVGTSLLLGGPKNLAVIDLETGDVTSKEVGGETCVVADGQQVYYQRQLARRAENGPVPYEIGRVDVRALALQPLFQFDARADEELSGIFAVSRDGSRFAVTSKLEDSFQVHVYEGATLVRTIPAGALDEQVELGVPVFSRDGSTIYAPYIKPMSDDGPHQFGVVELPVGGGSARQTPLFQIASGSEDSDAMVFQVDLSHDGKTLAGASTYLWKDKGEKLKAADLALYLIDVSRADRKVTKIPIAPPKPRGGDEKK